MSYNSKLNVESKNMQPKVEEDKYNVAMTESPITAPKKIFTCGWESIPVISPQDMKTTNDRQSGMITFASLKVKMTTRRIFEDIFSNEASLIYSAFYKKVDKASGIEITP